jgi:glycosyltransferase involved in cell wall biosynthesis
MSLNATVVICTWNRAELLDKTLAEMRNLRIPPGVEWELLVVNNHCTDATDEVLRKHQNDLPLRRLYEGTPGKSYAANLAIQEARGDLLLFTDDDVLVDKEWLAIYVAAAEAWPQASFFGGTVDHWFEVAPPRWLARNLRFLSSHYAIRNVDDSIIPLPKGESPFGANMAIRREALKAFPFNISLGPTKNNQVRGEECELFTRMRQAGHEGIWVGPSKVRHFIPAERLTKKFIWDWSRGHGRAHARVNGIPECSRLGGIPRWVIRKYVEKRVQAWILSPFKGRAWIRAYLLAALFRGIMDECRDTYKREIAGSFSAQSS